MSLSGTPLGLQLLRRVTTKILLVVKAALEAVAGVALLAFPSQMVFLLLGPRNIEPAGMAVGRIAGAALLTLGIACWLAHKESENRAARGLIVSLLFYDACVVAILLREHFGAGLTGIGTWPAIALHSGLGIWSILSLKGAKRSASG